MSCIKNTLIWSSLGLTALLWGTATSLAAELPPPPPPPPIEIRQSTYDWSGVYVGGLIGAGSVENLYVPIGTPDPEISGSGIVGGLMAGYNYQVGEFVVGAEADIMFTGIDNRSTVDGVEQEFSYLSTLRARAGWALDDTLIYLTGGVGIIRSKFSLLAPFNESRSKIHVGYVVGGGIETAFTENLIARAEYLYGSFGKKNYVYVPGTVRTGVNNLHIARAGIAYKF
ncbi:hypothetical protein MNBD_ALPHA08-108 [hydrothermal vent metagenome]|uniref:Outer membrane protein beta-barrel domain-containing protein n=1 Tax=hydrothermal vent metagenome TaxID=652676 RepID=A0A3B0S3Q8_9ZZZZ